MRKHSLALAWVSALCILVVACASTGGTGKAAPPVFTSPAGRFTIAAPADFVETQQTLESPSGTILFYIYTAQQGDAAFMASYCDYPEEIVGAWPDPQKGLDAVRDGALANINGRLVLENVVSLAGHPGREIVADAVLEDGSSITVKARFFMVGNRLYQVMVLAPKGEVAGSVMDSYLQSLTLLSE